MLAVKLIWNTLLSNIILNFWTHTKLVDAPSDVGARDEFLRAEEDILQNFMNQVVLSKSHMSIENVLNMDGEEDLVEEVMFYDTIEE